MLATSVGSRPALGAVAFKLEMDFMLSALDTNSVRGSALLSASGVVNEYHETLQASRTLHPRMYRASTEYQDAEHQGQWCIKETSDLENRDYSNFTLSSPNFILAENATWHDDINFMWSFLETTYRFSVSSACQLRIHTSVQGGFTLPDLQSIASSIIHFEMAFLALLPQDRQMSTTVLSNWFDNATFGNGSMSSRAAVERINRSSSVAELAHLMNPDDDMCHAWNFLHLIPGTGGLAGRASGALEYCRGVPSTSAEDTVKQVELVTAFIQAAIVLGNPGTFQGALDTVGGLQEFIDHGLPRYVRGQGLIVGSKGLNDPRNLIRFFCDFDPDAKMRVEPQESGFSRGSF